MPFDSRVGGVILAAGKSTRFGAPKLLARLGGRLLIEHALEAALESELDQVAVVCGPELAAHLRGRSGLLPVLNRTPEKGQAHSLALGLAALPESTSHALFLLADQPLVTPDLINDFVALSRENVQAAGLEYGGRLGPPALFARRHFMRLAALIGDQGGRSILGDPAVEALAVQPRHAWQHLDVDRPSELDLAARMLERSGNGKLELARVLGIEPPCLVSLVGAGGKTTALHRLARELGRQGLRVLVTTTTRIHPTPWRTVLEPDPDALAAAVAEGLDGGGVLAAAAGSEIAGGRVKLVGLAPETVDRLYRAGVADVILVEADGAARKPLKAPRAHEPVVPEATTLVLGLVGLKALGRAADEESVLGLAELEAVCGLVRGQAIGLEHLMRLIAHPEGLFKGAPPKARRVAVLNQADAVPELFEPAHLARCQTRPRVEMWAGSLGLGYLERLPRSAEGQR